MSRTPAPRAAAPLAALLLATDRRGLTRPAVRRAHGASTVRRPARVSDRGRILHYVTYLDRLATQATGHGFTPTLGYGLARPHQLPAAAWVQARAFTRYDPAVCRHPQLRVWWAVLRWPVSLIILSWRRARRALFVVPTRGRPEAIRPVAPPISYRRFTAFFLLVGGLVLMPLLLLASHDGPVPVVDPIAITLVRLVAPVLPVATALAGIVGLAVAASLLTHLGLGLSNPAARTKAPPLPGVVLELSGLAAWPERTRLGFGLFDAVLTDMDQQMPHGTTLLLTPANDGLRAKYQERGFTDIGVGRWMTRTTDHRNPPRLTEPLS